MSSKEMTTEELKELQRDFEIANAHHIAEERRRQMEEIFSVVFGYNGHRRYTFTELKGRINEAVNVLYEKWHKENG